MPHPAAYLHLTRPINAAIGALGCAAACVIAGGDGRSVMVLLPACAAVALITAGGNATNDVLDESIDRINRPSRALAAGTVTRRGAVLTAVGCSVAGLASAAASGLLAFLLAIAGTALILGYNLRLKRVPLLGNAVVSIVTGLAFPFGAAAAGNVSAGIVPGLLAAAFTFPRELFKDVEDVEGDTAGGIRTFPITHGARAAMRLAAVCCLLVLAATPLPAVFGLYSWHYLAVVIITVDILLLYIAITALRADDAATAGRLSRLMKVAMPGGILAILAGTIL